MFNLFKKKTPQPKTNEPLFSVANGNLIPITEVNDVVFAQKMMGDGFAVVPTSNTITSPVNGKVMSIFPSKHAISILTDTNIEVLVHIGLNTVELNGEGFNIQVKEGDIVSNNTVLAEVDFDFIKSKDKETVTIVVFTNMDVIDQFTVSNGEVTSSSQVGEIVLK